MLVRVGGSGGTARRGNRTIKFVIRERGEKQRSMKVITVFLVSLSIALAGVSLFSEGEAAALVDLSEPTALEVLAAGYSKEQLEVVSSYLEADASYGCMSVVKDGKLVFSNAWGSGLSEDDVVNSGQMTLSMPQRVNSISKSVVSAMFGVALQRGDIPSLDEPASTYIDVWKNSLSENVTIGELLTMTSGRYYSSTADYVWPQIIGVSSLRYGDELFSYSKYSTEILPQESRPGSNWVYNNAGVQALEVVLSEATGLYNVDEYAQKYLFEPLGMNNTFFATELVGKPILSGGLRTTCYDLSKLGQLYLMGGKTDNGEQIISSSYIELSTGTNGPATELNGAYGYLWWRPNHYDSEEPLPWAAAEPTYVTSSVNQCIVEYASRGRNEKILPNLPQGSYVAAGVFGYCFIVNPKENLIVAKLSPSGGPMLNDCDETYKLIESSKLGNSYQSEAEQAGCNVRDSEEFGAVSVEGTCLLEGTICNPFRSSWSRFLSSRFMSRPCCAQMSCELTYDRQYACF